MTEHVLVIEDELDVREIVGEAILEAGYAAVGVARGRAAVEYLGSRPAPRLILLDWHLPDLGGAEVMQEVMRNPKLADVPVVLMTGDVAGGGSAEIRFAALLPKPFTWDALVAVLQRFLPSESVTSSREGPRAESN
jgi:CheY-like chemotaxis protein